MFKSARYYDGTFDQEKFDAAMLASPEQDGLMSKEDKIKLDELAGSSSEEITVKASNVTEDASHRFVSDEQIKSWNAKPETKEAIELGNVTNDAQVKRSEMGVAGGVATLDDAGFVPASQLPSFVDDVLEFDSVEAFPTEGESGKIYIENNKSYRWSGSQYVAIPDSIALGETASTAYPGDKGKAHADELDAIITGLKAIPKAVDASTVNGFGVGAPVPANAKFTDTVYEHPSTHDAAMIVEDETHRFVTDEQISKWDIDNDTTYEPATAEVDGLMSAEDKAKLDEMYTIPTTPYYDEVDNVVYGCGMGITIEAAEEAGKIKIKYADTAGEKEFTAPEGINIYGGGNGVDNPVNYPAACVIMNSGLVKYIYGGNRRGSIGNVVIVVNGGTLTGGIVAGGHSAGTRESIVGHAEVVINNTDNEAGLVYAGGQGLSVVGTTRLIMNGGSVGWLTAGGSHGHTAMGEVIVNGGNIKVLQGCNRGTMGNIKLTINGGNITKVYAGGETGDASVTATYAKSEVYVNGGNISAISAGTDGGVQSTEKVSGYYVEGTISDEVASAMNLEKKPLSITDVVVEGNALVFKHKDKVVKSIELSTIA